MKLLLVGSRDHALEEMVRTFAPHASSVPLADLPTLLQGRTQPDAVIVDVRDQTVIPPAVTQLRQRHPSMGVVIVASTLDTDLMLSAMRAGVNECVALPLTASELEAAVTRVAAKGGANVPSQVFAFVGAKGGVCTTSIAVNVATSLARVATSGALMIDLQMNDGHAALYLGVEARFSVADVLANMHKLDEAYFKSVVVRAPGRLDLLAAPDVPGPQRLDPVAVRELLDFAARHFQFVILDVPRHEPAALEALDAATSIIVVTTQELPAVRSAARLAGRLRQRFGKDKVMTIMSRLDRQSDIRTEDVERVLGAPLAHTFPSDYRLTLASLNKGRPLVMEAQSALATSFKTFSRSLAGFKIEKPDRAQPAPWFGWLSKPRKEAARS